MSTIKANGIEIHYEQHGNGPDLVMIMGLGAHSGAWALNVPQLAERYRVTVFDNRGCGRTSAPDEPYSMGGMAEDTAALMDAIGMDRAHIVGASMGGMIAQEFAINHPGRVNRLVIACSRMIASELRRKVSMAQRALWASDLPRDVVSAIQMPWSSTPGILQDESLPLAALALQAKDPYPIAKHAYLRQLDATLAHDTVARLGRITAPTLVLVGAEDVLTPPHESVALAARIPGSELRILPRGGHGFTGEYAPQFNRAVVEFLGR